MPRYETDTKFWEIELAGSKYTQKWGKTGGSVSMNSKDCGSPGAAKKAFDKAIAKKQSEGFALVGGKAKKGKAEPAQAKAAPAGKPNPALEKAILANPDDADAYLVLADWLQGQGDPRGELIALQQAGKKKEATALLKKHPELVPTITPKPEKYTIEWAHGFLTKAHVGWAMYTNEMMGEDEDEDEPDDWGDACKKALLAFLQHPSTRFLQSLRLGCIPSDEDLYMNPYAAAIEKAAPPCLRVLMIDDTQDWDLSSTNAKAPAGRALPQLQELVISAGHIDLGKLEFPELRTLKVISGSLRAGDLKAISNAKLPKLEHLEIWCGDPNYGASGSVKDLATLFAGINVPKLTHLGLMNCPFADEGVKALGKSKLLPRLKVLDLTRGNLSDRGIDEMVAHKDAFKHLDLIDVDDNALTEASKPRLKGLAKKVNWGSGPRALQTPERAVPRSEEVGRWHRYVSVGE